MTYTFPPSLHPLRDFLKSKGFDGVAVKTSRQAAFVAQQLLGTRIKFPSQGSDMTSTLFLIQKAIVGAAPRSGPCFPPERREQHTVRKGKSKPSRPQAPVCDISTGIHIFCDGAAVPNPGVGGWGVVVYRDGVEIDHVFGGDLEATNNQMELTAILNAIEKAKELPPNCAEVTIWSDSQYCVNGCNEWRHGWKAKGWARGSDKAEPKNRILLNADLWKAIDEALLQSEGVSIKWVKGHAGIAGNERADELAEMGRQEQLRSNRAEVTSDDLDERYRQIMGAM